MLSWWKCIGFWELGSGKKVSNSSPMFSCIERVNRYVVCLSHFSNCQMCLGAFYYFLYLDVLYKCGFCCFSYEDFASLFVWMSCCLEYEQKKRREKGLRMEHFLSQGIAIGYQYNDHVLGEMDLEFCIGFSSVMILE